MRGPSPPFWAGPGEGGQEQQTVLGDTPPSCDYLGVRQGWRVLENCANRQQVQGDPLQGLWVPPSLASVLGVREPPPQAAVFRGPLAAPPPWALLMYTCARGMLILASPNEAAHLEFYFK